MSFSAEQSRKLDAIVERLAVSAILPVTGLVREFADETMHQKFGKVWDVAELHAAQTRVYAVTEQDVARELANRLAERLLNPHVTP